MEPQKTAMTDSPSLELSMAAASARMYLTSSRYEERAAASRAAIADSSRDTAAVGPKTTPRKSLNNGSGGIGAGIGSDGVVGGESGRGGGGTGLIGVMTGGGIGSTAGLRNVGNGQMRSTRPQKDKDLVELFNETCEKLSKSRCQISTMRAQAEAEAHRSGQQADRFSKLEGQIAEIRGLLVKQNETINTAKQNESNSMAKLAIRIGTIEHKIDNVLLSFLPLRMDMANLSTRWAEFWQFVSEQFRAFATGPPAAGAPAAPAEAVAPAASADQASPSPSGSARATDDIIENVKSALDAAARNGKKAQKYGGDGRTALRVVEDNDNGFILVHDKGSE